MQKPSEPIDEPSQSFLAHKIFHRVISVKWLVAHLLIAFSTIFIAFKVGSLNIWLVLLFMAPVFLAMITRIHAQVSLLTVRILIPISVGFLCMSFYQYLPMLLEGDENYIDKISQLIRVPGQLPIESASQGFPQRLDSDAFFFETVTVLYAICVAFLMLKGLNDHDELRNVLNDEGSELLAINDFCCYFLDKESPAYRFNSDIIAKLRSLLASYIDNILVDGKIRYRPENDRLLQLCVANTARLHTVDTNDSLALAEIMRGIATLRMLRSKRAVAVAKRMSPFIIALVAFLSGAIILPFFREASTEFGLNHIYVFTLSTFFAFIFMTLLDLSMPFEGYWQVKKDALQTAKDMLERAPYIDSVGEPGFLEGHILDPAAGRNPR